MAELKLESCLQQEEGNLDETVYGQFSSSVCPFSPSPSSLAGSVLQYWASHHLVLFFFCFSFPVLLAWDRQQLSA
jgi:hypothetical protein